MKVKRVSSVVESSLELPTSHRKDYKKVMNLFMRKLAFYVIKSGRKIRLPFGLGSIQAVKYKPKRKMVDFNLTKQYGKTIHHRHLATNGFWCRIHWFKDHTCQFKNKSKYSFRLTRPNRTPNSYNKNRPDVSLVPFFKEKGYVFYTELNKHNLDMKLKIKNK